MISCMAKAFGIPNSLTCRLQPVSLFCEDFTSRLLSQLFANHLYLDVSYLANATQHLGYSPHACGFTFTTKPHRLSYTTSQLLFRPRDLSRSRWRHQHHPQHRILLQVVATPSPTNGTKFHPNLVSLRPRTFPVSSSISPS
jgi:hypothetical protein